mmetsp:Transcript_22693/g.49118  ORF Transcript_22693/g.49118 Transcript_22693/m.49118 type:complete len:274 (-) Transcript_22693:2202-3023(-)
MTLLQLLLICRILCLQFIEVILDVDNLAAQILVDSLDLAELILNIFRSLDSLLQFATILLEFFLHLGLGDASVATTNSGTQRTRRGFREPIPSHDKIILQQTRQFLPLDRGIFQHARVLLNLVIQTSLCGLQLVQQRRLLLGQRGGKLCPHLLLEAFDLTYQGSNLSLHGGNVLLNLLYLHVMPFARFGKLTYVVLDPSHHVVQVGMFRLEALHLPHDVGHLLIDSSALLFHFAVFHLQGTEIFFSLFEGVVRAQTALFEVNKSARQCSLATT